jgi:hypothetical protein
MNLTRVLENQYGAKLQDASEEELSGLLSNTILAIVLRYRPHDPGAFVCSCIENTESDELLMTIAAVAYRMRFPIEPLTEEITIAA